MRHKRYNHPTSLRSKKARVSGVLEGVLKSVS